MNRSNIYITIILLVVLLFTACSAEVMPDRPVTSLIRFSLEFSDKENTRLTTDGSLKSAFEIGDEVGIFIYKREKGEESSIENNRLYADNIKMIYDGNSWYPESPIYYADDGALLDVYAYYPYKADAMAEALRYDAFEQMYDLLTASTFGVRKGDETVPLIFHHLLSLVQIRVDKTDRVPDFDATMSVYFKGVISGEYNLATRDVSNIESGAVGMTIVGEEDLKVRTYRALVPAQYIESGRLFTFAQTTPQKEFSLVKDVTEPISLSQGRVYRLDITLDQEMDKAVVYNLYDRYPNYGTPIGIVVKIFNEGRNGIVISLRDLGSAQWSTGNWYTGIRDVNDGISNKMKIQSQPDWENRYPAFKLCTSLGEDWYLPAMEEAYAYLYWYRSNINGYLASIEDSEPIAADMSYLTSTEAGDDVVHKVYTGNGSTEYFHKVALCRIRAFYEF
jgi:hypothetical protein